MKVLTINVANEALVDYVRNLLSGIEGLEIKETAKKTPISRTKKVAHQDLLAGFESSMLEVKADIDGIIQLKTARAALDELD